MTYTPICIGAETIIVFVRLNSWGYFLSSNLYKSSLALHFLVIVSYCYFLYSLFTAPRDEVRNAGSLGGCWALITEEAGMRLISALTILCTKTAVYLF